jgi:hypothetical protein
MPHFLVYFYLIGDACANTPDNTVFLLLEGCTERWYLEVDWKLACYEASLLSVQYLEDYMYQRTFVE